MPRTQVKAVAEWLARAMLAGDSAVESIVHRLAVALGRDWRWLTPLTKRYRARFVEGVRPRHRDTVKFLLEDAGFTRACEKYGDRIVIRNLPLTPQSMQPVSAARNWNIPALETVRSLADWLHVDPGELEWFADIKTLAMKKQDERLGHYYYRVLAKPGGSLRLIEIPKPRIKQLQRQILAEILEKVPAHGGSHGFVAGRSTMTFATPHVDKPLVLRMDVSDFFPSFRYARIEGFFRTLGYPEAVARLLAGTCTNAVPRRIWADRSGEFHHEQALYSRRHLPQGAPTSPALSNLCSYRVDCRLAGLANAAGAVYTRYADDLAFSGHADFSRSISAFRVRVAAILLEEGFAIHHRKTRMMRRSVRQHLAGLVVNERLNTSRSDFDTLKAILTNCTRTGPASQNFNRVSDFRAHVEGRVSYVEMVNAGRGKRLRALLSRIEWP